MPSLAVIFTNNTSIYLLVYIIAREGYCDVAVSRNKHVARPTVLGRTALLPRETLQSATVIAALLTETYITVSFTCYVIITYCSGPTCVRILSTSHVRNKVGIVHCRTVD